MALPVVRRRLAEQVVRRQARQEGQDHGHEQPIQNRSVEGQIEGEEPDIVPEFGVRDAHRAAVQEQLNRDPVRLGDQTAQHADTGRDAASDQPRSRDHRGSVGCDRIVGPRGRQEDRPPPVGQRHGDKNSATHHQRHRNEDRQAGEQHGDPHAAEADLPEPQPIDAGIQQRRRDQQYRKEPRRHQQQHAGGSGQGRSFVRTGLHVQLRSSRFLSEPVVYAPDGGRVAAGLGGAIGRTLGQVWASVRVGSLGDHRV